MGRSKIFYLYTESGYSCCDKNYSSATALKLHKKKVHGVNEKFSFIEKEPPSCIKCRKYLRNCTC